MSFFLFAGSQADVPLFSFTVICISYLILKSGESLLYVKLSICLAKFVKTLVDISKL